MAALNLALAEQNLVEDGISLAVMKAGMRRVNNVQIKRETFIMPTSAPWLVPSRAVFGRCW